MATKSVKKSIKEAARMGKGRDNTIAHLASGEIVIPLDFQKKFPAVGTALRQAFEKSGFDYEQFVVGSPKNRINPRTGAPMFDDGGGGGDGGGGDGGGGDGGGGDGGDGGGGDGGDAGGGDAGGDAGGGYGGDEGGGYGGDEGGGYGGGYGDASSGEGASADEGGGGFGGFGGGFGDSGDASSGSTGDQGGGPAGDQGGGPAGDQGGGPTGDQIGGDPDPDIPAGDPMEYISPGQTNFNSLMDGLLGTALSGAAIGDLTSEDVRGGFQGIATPSQDRAEALAREDALYSLQEEVARNEEVANTIMASQAAQQAAAAAAAAAGSNVTSGGLLSGESILDNSLGLTAANPGVSDIFGGPVYSSGTTTSGPTTNEDTTSFPASDIAGTTGNMGMGSTQGQQGDIGAATSGSGLSELGVTEVAPAPSIFDLSETGNLPVGNSEDDSNYVSGDGGDIIRPLTEEQRMIVEQLAAEEELRRQQATVRPTVAPVQYDISKFISGIGSLATSKQA